MSSKFLGLWGKFILRKTYRKIVFSCQEKKDSFSFSVIESVAGLFSPFPFDLRFKIGYPSAARGIYVRSVTGNRLSVIGYQLLVISYRESGIGRRAAGFIDRDDS